jgi:serine/threonine protein kinase
MGSDPKIAPTLAAPEATETLTKPVAPLSGHHPRVDARVSTVVDGRYLIESVLGEGGMGIVYRARHRLLDQIVAMKVLRGEMARSEEMVDRFLHEARIASSIRSPHLVTVSDFGVLTDGATYFVMEHLDGVNLTRVLRDQAPLSIPRILHIGKQIARGVGAAHSAGIVHRDLKPDNIMLVDHAGDKDFVKILDFGIAKIATRVTSMTAAGAFCGTPHYMSPEQAAGDAVDKHADIYALGVMLYELVAGHVPFDSESVLGLIAAHVNRAPPALIATAKRNDVPPSLEALVMRCLAKKVEDRYPSMDAVADDLQAIDDDLIFAAVNEAPPIPKTGIRMREVPVQTKQNLKQPPPVRRNSGAHVLSATTPPKAAGTIIVVDDSEICREIATLMLTDEGFEVIALADPSTLSDALGATQPALVLVDVTMPGMGGEALVRRMRQDCGVQCPMVLHSDLPEDKLVELARTCEASGYIRKTADARRFSEELRKFLPD